MAEKRAPKARTNPETNVTLSGQCLTNRSTSPMSGIGPEADAAGQTLWVLTLDQRVDDAEAGEQAERHDHDGEKTDRHDQSREQRNKQEPQDTDHEGAHRMLR